MNRLADYLYVLARYTDAKAGGALKTEAHPSEDNSAAAKPQTADATAFAGAEKSQAEIVREVLRNMGIQGRITLEAAKRLIEKIEQEAARRGKQAVIAVCNPQGNPIAVHAMDGALSGKL